MLKNDETLAAEGNYITTHRVEALHDGVFAIVMTLLVFGIHIPEAFNAHSLQAKMIELLPTFVTYILTFVTLGIYWVGLHNEFHYIKRSDRMLLWISLFFLMFVSILPFTTGLLGRYPNLQLPYILYGTNLIIIGIINYALWTYATRHHRLTEHTVSVGLIRWIKRRIVVAPVICVIAIGASFYNLHLSLACYLLVPPYYLLPKKADPFRHHPAIPHED